MALRLLRTLRLDGSDDVVFERAAADGEIAVPGTFQFWADDLDRLAGRRRQAFRSGFLGLGGFGFSTLAVVATASAADRDAAAERLAGHLLERWGAPDRSAAMAAARDELGFAESLAEQPEGTVVALARTVEDGAIRERFRTLHRAEAREDLRAGRFRVITALPDDDFVESTDIRDLQPPRGDP